MATNTTKLALSKPDGTDLVDIAVLNGNFDKIDAASGATICTSSTRPASPWNGQVIFETDTLNALVYRTATSSWAILGGSTVASDPPVGAGNGNFWWDSDNGKLYIYYNDGNSGQWVSVMPSQTQVVVSPNYVLNGSFDIWQRGTSFSNPNNSYTADRWLTSYSGSGSTRTVSRQTVTPGTDLGRETKYYINLNQTVAGTGATWNEFATLIEDARTLAGKTVTFSFWAKSSSSSAITGTFIGQSFGVSGRVDTPISPLGSPIQLTTSWARYSYTTTLPGVSGKSFSDSSYLFVAFQLPLNATYNIDIANVQLEEGPMVTVFRTNQPNAQAELAACQRYYVRLNQNGYESTFGSGIQTSTTAANCFVPLPVPLRATPTSIGFFQVFVGDRSTVANPATPINFADGTLNGLTLAVSYSAFGAQFRPCTLQGKGATPYNAYLEVTAEL